MLKPSSYYMYMSWVRPELDKFFDNLTTDHLDRMIKDYCEESGYYQPDRGQKLHIPKDLYNMIVAKDSGLTIKVNGVQLQFDPVQLDNLGYDNKLADYLAGWLKAATELENTKRVEIVSCNSGWAREILEEIGTNLHLDLDF